MRGSCPVQQKGTILSDISYSKIERVVMDDIYVKQYGNRASETRRNSGLKGQKWALLASAISLGMVFMET